MQHKGSSSIQDRPSETAIPTDRGVETPRSPLRPAAPRGAWPALPVVITFLVTVAALAPLARLGVDPHHDGIMLKPALDVLDGQVLHRDSFTQYGTLTTLIQAGWLGVFGETLLALKALTVVTYGVVAALLFLIWKDLSNTRWAALGVALWLSLVPAFDYTYMLLPWSSVFALMFQAAVLLALIRFLAEPTRGACFSGGAGVAGCFLTRQTVGGLLGLVVAVILIAEWSRRAQRFHVAWRELPTWSAGFAAVLLPVAVVLVVTGAIDEYFFQNYVYPRTWAASLPSGLFGYMPGFARDNALSWGGRALVAVLFLVALARLPGRRRSWSTTQLGWLGLAIGLLLLGLFVYGTQPSSFWSPTKGAYWSIATVLVGGIAVLATRSAITFVREGRKPLGAVDNAVDVRRRQLLAAGLVGLASLAQILPISDDRHLFWAVSPAVGLSLLLVRRFINAEAISVGLALAIVGSTTLVTVQEYRQNLATPRIAVTGIPILEGMLTAKIDPFTKVLPLAVTLQRFLDCSPRTPVVVDDRDALYAAQAYQRKNPDPYYVNWTLLPRDQAGRKRFLAEQRPAIWFVGLKPSAFVTANGYTMTPRESADGSPESLGPWLLLPGDSACSTAQEAAGGEK